MLLLAHAAPAASGTQEVNAEGGACLTRGDYAGAERRFREGLALEPASPSLRRGLSLALQAQAQDDMRGGRWEQARERAREATDLAPDAMTHFLLAMIQFRLGDLYDSRLHADRALELDPANAPARELSGDLWYQEGALARAVAEWEAALPGAGGRAPGLRGKIERARRETGAEAGFGRDVSRHFTLQFDGPVPPDVAREALRLLEEAYDRLWRQFGRTPRGDLPVILYSRRLFDELVGGPGWAGGVYDGKIRVPVGGLHGAADAGRLRPVLAHELAHAFIHANATGPLPLWFEEGLAESCAGQDREAARAHLGARGQAFSSLAEVDAALRGGGMEVGAAYAAALLAVQTLLGRDGFWLARRLLEAVDGGLPFAEALARETGGGIGELEVRWRALLR